MSKLRIAILGLAVVIMVSPVFAHHGNAAYDNRTVTVKGVVTEWKWTNPHTFLKIDSKDENGEVVHWIGEWNAPSTLVNFGITAKSFKPGDEVTVTMRSMAKGGTRVGRVEKVITPDGQVLSMGSER